MYEMLTGRVPFTGSLFELINAHREHSPPPLSEFVGGVDPQLEYTVMRMLAKDPAQRWSSLTEVVQRLSAHTTVQHGDESLRATLSLAGTFNPTPRRGVGAVDVLTPPGSAPVSPLPVSPLPVSPLPVSPLPFEPPQSPVPAATLDDGNSPRPTAPRRGLMIGGAAALVIAVVAAVAVWGMRSDSPAPAPIPPAPVTPPASQVPPPATPDSAVRDSVARDSSASDSTAKALAGRDSARADSVARATARADSTAKAGAAAAALASRRDSAAKASPKGNPPRRTNPVRPESIAVQCARLLERASLGERLTDAERALLQRRCPR
jgi:serine/threonine protein kinase